MNDGILSLVGLAKKAGKLAVGEEPVSDATHAHKARLVLCAGDASENTLRRASGWAAAGNAPFVRLPCSKEELGRAVGCAACAMAALTDAGLASSLAEKLAARDEAAWGALAGELKGKAEKLLRRRREKGKKSEEISGRKRKGPGGKAR